MDDSVKVALALAYAYLLGSVPSGYLVGKLVRGVDLRNVGSGTVGGSNVWYNVGKRWIFPVGIFDLFVKGTTPVYVAQALGLDLGVQVGAGLLAVVGHNWPVFLKFRGGRGVSPIVGVLVALGRLELGVFIIIGTAGWRVTHASAVWVLVGMASLPLLALWWDRPTPTVLLMAGILTVTVVKRLASNGRNPSGSGLVPLLWNRLVFDRDIRDHDAWVRRGQAAPEQT